jgi:four helix bundle protein
MESVPAERNSAFFRFEELRIYHKALDYINWVHQATEGFGKESSDNIAICFNQTARTIAMNIAEGSARNKSQFIYYLKMAKSAVREALVLTSASHNLGYLDEDQNSESRGYLMEMTKMIGALISSLQRSNQDSSRDNDESEDDMIDDTKKYDSHSY